MTVDHMVPNIIHRSSRPFSSVFAYWKQSNVGGKMSENMVKLL